MKCSEPSINILIRSTEYSSNFVRCLLFSTVVELDEIRLMRANASLSYHLTAIVFGQLIIFSLINWQGDSANAVPHYHKLCTRLTHIWGNRRGQPNLSAMVRPRPEGSAFMSTESSVPGKYAYNWKPTVFEYTEKTELWCVLFYLQIDFPRLTNSIYPINEHDYILK